MIMINAEIIHHRLFKSKISFNANDICFIFEDKDLFTGDSDDEYNEVDTLTICFKNGKTISIIKTDVLMKSLLLREA